MKNNIMECAAKLFVLDRGWSKHNRVYLECEGHYYEYSWQFCLG